MPEISLTRAPAHLRHGSNIGQPLTRRDGVLKVKGEARFAADNHPAGMLHAVLAVSSIARGRVTFLDVQAAKSHPGVVEVMTSANKPPLAEDPDAKVPPFMFRLDLLQNDQVRCANQPIAVVIAETLEAATEGAVLLSPRYEVLPARFGLDAGESFLPAAVGISNPAEMRRGDVEAGLAMASRRIDATYGRPRSTTMRWNRTPSWRRRTAIDYRSIRRPGSRHGPGANRRTVRHLTGQDSYPQPLPGWRLRIEGPDPGPQILGILAARLVGRPVKLVLRREHMYGPVGHRAPTRQRLRIGADGDGPVNAIDHRAKTVWSTSMISSSRPRRHACALRLSCRRRIAGAVASSPARLSSAGAGTGNGILALEHAMDGADVACGWMVPTFQFFKELCQVEPNSASLYFEGLGDVPQGS